MKSATFSNAMSYSLGGTHRHVERKYCLHFQGLKVSQATSKELLAGCSLGLLSALQDGGNAFV